MSLPTINSSRLNIGIMGAGAFGTSLAILYSHFHNITFFSSFEDHVDSMKKTRKNEFLKGFDLPEMIDIRIVSELKSCVFDYILWCFPTSPSLEILRGILTDIPDNVPIVICSKGITSLGTFLLDEFVDLLPNNPVGVLSGPNFAVDIASLSFSAADIGFKAFEISRKASKDLSNHYMRIFPTCDVIGMQIAGAIKNIIAIACGILVGLGSGQNAVSAMLTYGLQEMSLLGVALGAQKDTFYGLSGVGDLMLTASSETSRNMFLGKRLGLGESIEEIQKDSALAEGGVCVSYILDVSHKLGLNTPICNTVFEIISGKISPKFMLNILVDKN